MKVKVNWIMLFVVCELTGIELILHHDYKTKMNFDINCPE